MIKIFLFALFLALGFLVAFRVLLLLVAWCIKYFSGGELNLSSPLVSFFNGLLSVIHITFFSFIFNSLMKKYMPSEVNLLEGFSFFISLGIFGLVWCYFRWEFKLKSFPRLDIDENSLFLMGKKIFIYALMLVCSFYYGFLQLKDIVYGHEIDPLSFVFCAIIMPCTVAIDRLLNQLVLLARVKKCVKEK